MDEMPHKLARRGAFFITCRPDVERFLGAGRDEFGIALRGANRKLLTSIGSLI